MTDKTESLIPVDTQSSTLTNTPVDIDDRIGKVMNMINSMDVPEEERQKYHDISELMITLAQQYPGGVEAGFESLMQGFLDREKRSAEGIVDDTPHHEKIADLLSRNIEMISSFYDKDPLQYHNNMKSSSVSFNIRIIKEFKDNVLAKQEHGGIISDFLEKIFAEFVIDYFYESDNDEDDEDNDEDDEDNDGDDGDEDKVEDHVTRLEKLDIFGRAYKARIRSVLPQKECYSLISILYETYKVIGRNDLTAAVTDAIENWLIDNNTAVKSSNKG